MADPFEQIQIRVLIDFRNERSIRVRNSRTMNRNDIYLPTHNDLAKVIGEEQSDGTVTIELPRGLAKARGLVE